VLSAHGAASSYHRFVATNSQYDEHVDFYLDFVDSQLADSVSLANVLAAVVQEVARDQVRGGDVLDVACGEGYLARRLLALGPRSVVGIDASENLLTAAAERTAGLPVVFRLDDAQTLATVPDNSIDAAVSQMAIMDIPDIQAMFGAVARVLRPGGTFTFSMLHPCFQTPFRFPNQPPHLLEADDSRAAVLTRRYATEGYWQSGGTGVRGHMGAYHRTLATILNGLLSAGFALRELREPLAGGSGLDGEVPFALVVHAEI